MYRVNKYWLNRAISTDKTYYLIRQEIRDTSDKEVIAYGEKMKNDPGFINAEKIYSQHLMKGRRYED